MPGTALANVPDGLDSIATAAPASPSDALQLIGHAMIMSDYRFRGTSYSLGKPVAQVSLVAAHESGLYGGVFISSLGNHETYGAVEVDLFAGFMKPIAPGVMAEVSLYYYYFPDKNPAVAHTNSFETEVKLSGNLGAFSPKIGVWYAWEQAAFGGRDNVYLFGDLLWRVPGTRFEAKVHGGYTHGSYSISPDRTTVDWSVGMTYRATDSIRLGVEYVGIGGPKVQDFTDDAIVATLSINL
jgi:uncharacterized protein (TIGR02001 family)